MFNLSETVRVMVDPNTVVPSDPTLSASFFEDATKIPNVGDYVLAVQPDNDDANAYVGSAKVERVDQASRLIYLRVDWRSFVVEGAMVSNPAIRMSRHSTAYASARSSATLSQSVDSGHTRISFVA